MSRLTVALSSLVLLAAPAVAAPADEAAIRAAIIGNTVQGEMTVSGGYTEFYATNGEIHGKDYTGKWTIEGDRMCFQYGEEPSSCWQVEVDGQSVNWLKDGRIDGSGIIVPGNPNNY